jgi:hypothetical protein
MMKKIILLSVLLLICGQSKAQISFGIYAAPHITRIHQKQIPYDYNRVFINENTHNSWGAGFYASIPLADFLYLKNETGYSRNITSLTMSKGEYRVSEYVQSSLLAGYIPFYKRNDLLKGLSVYAGPAIKYRYSGPVYFYYDNDAPNMYYSLMLGASFNYKMLTLSPFADISLTPHSKTRFSSNVSPPYEFHIFFRNYGLKLSCKVF